jgi:gliding motility-associated lipoprotein GldH
MLRHKLKFIFLVGFAIWLQACNYNSLYDENISIEEKGWYKDDLATFEVAVTDTLQSYNFYINIRNTVDYRYSNLYIFMNTKFPNNNVSRDTLEFILADIEGKWLGKGWGAVKENAVLISAGMRFPLKGYYEFKIQHAMRQDTLKGIKNMGIRITPSE